MFSSEVVGEAFICLLTRLLYLIFIMKANQAFPGDTWIHCSATLVLPTSSCRLLFYLDLASQGMKEIVACCCLLHTCGWVLFLHMLMLALPPVHPICSSSAAKSCEISQMKTALPALGGSCTIILLKRFSSSWKKIRSFGVITLMHIKARAVISVLADSLHMSGKWRTALVDLDHLLHAGIA